MVVSFGRHMRYATQQRTHPLEWGAGGNAATLTFMGEALMPRPTINYLLKCIRPNLLTIDVETCKFRGHAYAVFCLF